MRLGAPLKREPELSFNSKLAYVGSTGDFRKPIQHHAAMRRFQIDKIAFRPVDDISERLAIESQHINQFKPVFNRQRQAPQPRNATTGRFERAS